MKLKFCLWVVLIELTAADFLPSFISPCYSGEYQLEVNKCVLEEARRIQETFMRGLPEYGVDSMDPLLLGVLTPAKDLITTVQQKMTRIQGLSKMHIKDIKLDTNGIIEICLHGDLLVTSDFDAEVRMLFLSGSGKFTVNLNDVNIVMRFQSGKVADQDQREHFHIDDAVTNMVIGDFDIRVTHLTGSLASAEFLIRKIVQLFKHHYITAFGQSSLNGATKAIVRNLNNFFSRIPVEDLFASTLYPKIDVRFKNK